ncbi:MAG: HAD hydrolase-like protein [Gemmatimonas sp.]
MRAASRAETLWGTLRQTAPHLGLVLRHMKPTWHVNALGSITPAFLALHGIRGIIWDVDGTLTAYHDARVARTSESALHVLLSNPTLRHVIVSNSPESRFAALGTMLPSVPALRVYALGRALHVRTLLGAVDSMAPDTLAVLLNGGAYALRKPNAALVRSALQLLGCGASQAVMIGDQYLTDIAGAGMTNVRSIKVATIVPSSFPLSIRSAQVVEHALYALRHGMRPAAIDHPVRDADG